MVAQLARTGGLELDPAVTFLVGDNGTGKSTLVEALAVGAGFNARAARSRSGSPPALPSPAWVITSCCAGAPPNRGPGSSCALSPSTTWPPRSTGWTRKAPTRCCPPTVADRCTNAPTASRFLDLVTYRFGPGGLYLLDEPEAALSVRGCLALVARIADLIAQGGQFVVATHSPIPLAVPGARILQIDPNGQIEQVSYDEADPFAADPRIPDRPGPVPAPSAQRRGLVASRSMTHAEPVAAGLTTPEAVEPHTWRPTVR